MRNKKTYIILLMLLVITFLNINDDLKADTTKEAGFNFKVNLLGGTTTDEFSNIFNYEDGYLVVGLFSSGGDLPSSLTGSQNLVAIKYDKSLNPIGYKLLASDVGMLHTSFLDKDGNLLVSAWIKGEEFINKYDKNGNLLFSYNQKGTNWKENKIIGLKDGSYLILSNEFGSPNGSRIRKISDDGKDIWEYQIGYKKGDDNKYYDAKELPDGSIIVAGSTKGGSEIISHPNTDLTYRVPVVFKLDKDGNRVWDYTIEPNNEKHHMDYHQVEIKNDKIYFFVAKDTFTNCEVYVFDFNGNLLNSKNIGYTEQIKDIEQTSDGGFLLTGYNYSDDKAVLGKYDKEGNLEWQSTKLGKGAIQTNDSIVTSDGYYISVGGAYPKGLSMPTTGNGSEEALILKNDYVPILKSDSELILHVNDNKKDDELLKLFNVSAIDKEEGDLTSSIIVDQSKVDYNTPGEYDVVFNVKDSSNIIDNTGKKELNEVNKVVKLKIINDKPIISADSEEYSPLGKTISDDELKTLFNVKASDYEDGDLYSSVVVDSSSVDFNKEGDYNVTFTVTDSLGEVSTITVILHITNEKPVINADDKHQGHINEVLSDDDLLKLFNVSASDLEDGDLTSKVTIDSSAVDFNTEGTYEIVLTVTDSDGNKVEKKVNIEIVADMNPELISDDYKDIEEGTPFSDSELKQLFNVSASDYEDGDLTSNVVVDQSGVDYNTPGEYEIKFYIIDSYGNKVEKIVTLKITKANKPITPDKPTDSGKSNNNSESNSKKKKLIQSGKNSKLIIVVTIVIMLLLIGKNKKK